MNYLIGLADKLHLNNYISFLGLRYRDYIYYHLSDYDLLVKPSLFEGFGLTIVEGKASGIEVLVSDIIDLELFNAPRHVREHLFQFSSDKFERVQLTEEAIQLADTYISEKVVGKTSLEDSRHIAMATIHKVDVLASWNFKHIVNLDSIKGYNSVNLRLGYSIIEIRSPKDLVKYEND